jgi:acetolactate synthase-1/2/3 large subunit
MALVRGAEAAVQALVNEGATTLFGIPGVTSLELYDAFVDHPELRHVETRHEQGAVFMADGYSRASGEPGVACTSGGPGALNTLTAMGTAYNDGVPVLHLVSENERTLRGKSRGFFHDVNDQLGVFRSVIDYAAQVLLPEEIPGAVHGAAYALRNRRPRPALVELPGDVLKARAEMAYPERAARVERAPAEAQVRAAAELLAGAKTPVIWAGSGVGWAGAGELLRQVAERLGAPVLTSQLGKGAIPADHPLHVGNWASERPVQELLARSDAMLAVGTRFTYFPTRGWSLRLPPKLVHVDLDPAEIGRNYPVSVGVVGHARPALAGLLAELERLGAGVASRAAEVQSAREAML